MRGGWGPAMIAAAVVILAGCSEEGVRGPTAEIVDSAGVRIVTYDLTDVAIPAFAGVGEPELEIGGVDGESEYLLSRIIDLRTLDDGSIVIADGGGNDLRVYDPKGGHLRTLGQRGEGPGEFAAAPFIAGLAGDTLFAWDETSRRVTSFSGSGDLIETTRLQAEAAYPVRVIRLDDGTYVSQAGWVASGPDPLEAHDMRLELDSLVIEHIAADGAVLDTIRVLADQERIKMRQIREGGRQALQMTPRPLTARAFVRSDGVRPIIGHNDAFELVSYGPDGASRQVLRVEGVWPSVSAGEIRSTFEARLAEASEDGELDPRTLRLYDEFLPARTPAFSNVIIGGDGSLWVAQFQFDRSNGFEWLVFSPEGELRGTVRTPPDLRVFEIREGSVLGVVLDDFDVPFVRRHPLLLNGSGAR